MRRAVQSLPHLTLLDLYNTDIDVSAFRNLLQSFRRPPGSLGIRLYRGLDPDEMLDVITEHNPKLWKLRIYRPGKGRGAPIRYDYLASLPKLLYLHLRGDCLAWDSLQHVGPKLKSLTLSSCELSAAELVSSMLMWSLNSDRAVKISNTAYDERERSTLIVSYIRH